MHTAGRSAPYYVLRGAQSIVLTMNGVLKVLCVLCDCWQTLMQHLSDQFPGFV